MSKEMMRRVLIPLTLSIIFVLALSVLVVSAPAEQQRQAEGYAIDWWTVDGGGSSGPYSPSGYALKGTVGQADTAVMAEGGYTLKGGFWGGLGLERWYRIRLLLIFKNAQI